MAITQFVNTPPVRKSKFLRISFEWTTANGANSPYRMRSFVRGLIAPLKLEAPARDSRAPDNINAPASRIPDPVDFIKRAFREGRINKSDRKKQ